MKTENKKLEEVYATPDALDKADRKGLSRVYADNKQTEEVRRMSPEQKKNHFDSVRERLFGTAV